MATTDDVEFDLVPIPLHRLPAELQGDIDRSTGAPGAWRAQVGTHSRPEQRLEALRRLAPDASAYGDDNFTFRHPQTGRRTLYNPPGVDWGDVASLGPELGEMVGGGLGAAGGAASGFLGGMGLGAVPGGIAGAAAGATAGREMVERGIRSTYGTPDSRTGGQQLQDAATTAAVNGAGQGVAPIIARGVKATLGVVPRLVSGAVNRVAGRPQSLSQPAADVVRDFEAIGAPLSAATVTGNRTAQGFQRAANILPVGSAMGTRLAERETGAVERGVQGAVDEQVAASRLPAQVAARTGVTPGQTPSARLAARITAQEAEQRSLGGSRAGANAGRRLPGNSALAGATGAPVEQDAGAVIREGIERAGLRQERRVNNLEARATQLIGDTTPVRDLPQVGALRRDIERMVARAPEDAGRALNPVLERIARMEDDAATMGYRGLREMRTRLRQEMDMLPRNTVDPHASQVQAAYERLHGALSGDMFALADSVSPEAGRALRVATRYNALTNENPNFLPALRRVVDKNSDEELYRALFPAGGKVNTQRVGRLMNQLEAPERHAVAATVLARLGEPPPGSRIGQTFSVPHFLTNWEKLTGNNPEARNVVLREARIPGLAPQLDRLVRVSQRLKDYGSTENWSGTARSSVGAGILLSSSASLGHLDPIGALVTLAGGAAAGGGTMALMTNPRFVRWLADVVPTYTTTQKITRQQLAALGRVASTNPMLRGAWENFRATFDTSFNPSPSERRDGGTRQPQR
jgi:hypothetical protein